MNRIGYSLLITAIISFYSTGLAGQGYRIEVNIADGPEMELILAHRLGLKFYTDDTVKTDHYGRAVFEGREPLPEGMYQLVFPEKKFAEFFLEKQQDFSLSTRAAAPADSLSFTKSPHNTRFLKWQRDYAANRSRSARIQSRLKQGNLSSDSTLFLNNELHGIQQENNHIWDSAVEDLAETLPGNFIRGLKPVRVPATLGPASSEKDQYRQYQYVRTHFLDEVDFSDQRLIRTPVIETKLDQYFKQIVPPVADTIIQDARKIIERTQPGTEMYQFVVQFLFNLYSNPEVMGTDAVYVYMAENYYLAGQTPWVDSINLVGIDFRVKELKPLLLGKPAPKLMGLVDPDEQPVDINEIKSKYLVLYFWSPDCSFCKEATPKLHKDYAELQKLGTEVVAVDTRVDKAAWTTFIKDHQLNWVNVYSPEMVQKVIENYQAYSTPTLFILDTERKIIAKSISVEQVLPFFRQYLGIK